MSHDSRVPFLLFYIRKAIGNNLEIMRCALSPTVKLKKIKNNLMDIEDVSLIPLIILDAQCMYQIQQLNKLFILLLLRLSKLGLKV